MNPLTQIPPKVRMVLYWAGYVLGVVSSGITVVWASVAAVDATVAMPLGLLVAQGVITLLVSQLNLLAGSNMPSMGDVANGDVELSDLPEPWVG